MKERVLQFVDRHDGVFAIAVTGLIALLFCGAMWWAMSYGAEHARADAEVEEKAFRESCANAGGVLFPRKASTWNGGFVSLIDCVRPQANEAEAGR